jgi:hypothetical protein
VVVTSPRRDNFTRSFESILYLEEEEEEEEEDFKLFQIK